MVMAIQCKLMKSYPWLPLCSSTPFLESLRKRGLKVEEVVCGSNSVRWYGEKTRTKRAVKLSCYYLDGTISLYMRPVEGITMTVDLDEIKIVWYRDRLTVPIPKADATDYRRSQQQPQFLPRLKGIKVLQPDGPSFTLDGSRI